MAIRAIIFDYGGVFSEKASLRDFCDRLARGKDADAEAMKDLMISLWLKARVDEMDSEELFRQVADLAGTDLTEFKKKFFAFFGFRDELLAFVKNELKGTYKVGILSNNIRSWFEPIIEEKRLHDIFDVIVTSYGARIAKPDFRIFEEIVRRLDVKPDECIYIDDMKKNIPPAQELGMETILFRNFDQFRRELNHLLRSV